MGVTVETLYEAWERELAQLRHEPDAALIAALEWRARELGFDLVELHDNLTAAAVAAEVNGPTPTPDEPPLPPGVDWDGMATDEEDGVTDEDLVGLPVPRNTTASGLIARANVFDPDLHPRDHLGQFIETLGFIKIIGGLDKGNHGQVVDVTPNPKTPGKPIIHYRQTDARGNQIGPRLGAELAQVEAINEKARLDKPTVGDRRTDLDVDLGPDTSRAPYKPLDLTAPVDYSPKASTISAEQSAAIAQQMREGRPVTVNDVDVDDVILNFVHDEGSPDLTLMSQFPTPADGRTRSEMPQIPKDQLDNFTAALDDEGIMHARSVVDPRTLTATQAELNGKNVAELIASTRAGTFNPADKPVWISSDNKVLDGHHRWAAAVALAMDGSDVQFPVIRVDMPMDELLDFADEFNAEHGVAHRDIGEVQDRTYVPPTPAPNIPTPADVARAQAVQARRAKITADINAESKKLSTTDANVRHGQLDVMFEKLNLRGSEIDTDQVHDHLAGTGSERWTPERQELHEEMWQDLLADIEANGIPKDRQALALGGLPGAGKSSSLKPGKHGEQLGVASWEPGGDVPEGVTHVSINPDIVKEMLIARDMLPPGIEPDLKPMEQVNFIHEESSYLGTVFSDRLSKLGYNLVLDNTMASVKSMSKRMQPLGEQGYRFKALFADISLDESLKSAKKRYVEDAFKPLGGRYVPSGIGKPSEKGNLSMNRDVFDALREEDWFFEYMVIDNTGISDGHPLGEVVDQGVGTGTAASALAIPAPPPFIPPTITPPSLVPPAGPVAVLPGEPAAPGAAPSAPVVM